MLAVVGTGAAAGSSFSLGLVVVGLLLGLVAPLLLVVVVVVVGLEDRLMPPRAPESQCRCSRGQVVEEEEEDDEETGLRAAASTYCCVPTRQKVTAASHGTCCRGLRLLVIIVESGVWLAPGRKRKGTRVLMLEAGRREGGEAEKRRRSNKGSAGGRRRLRRCRRPATHAPAIDARPVEYVCRVVGLWVGVALMINAIAN